MKNLLYIYYTYFSLFLSSENVVLNFLQKYFGKCPQDTEL